MKYLLLTIAAFLLYSCNNSTSNSTSLAHEESIDTSLLMANTAVCDSCISTLVVHHSECTECKDIYVDSGTVFITN